LDPSYAARVNGVIGMLSNAKFAAMVREETEYFCSTRALITMFVLDAGYRYFSLRPADFETAMVDCVRLCARQVIGGKSGMSAVIRSGARADVKSSAADALAREWKAVLLRAVRERDHKPAARFMCDSLLLIPM
jgi:hypothetical protein